MPVVGVEGTLHLCDTHTHTPAVLWRPDSALAEGAEQSQRLHLRQKHRERRPAQVCKSILGLGGVILGFTVFHLRTENSLTSFGIILVEAANPSLTPPRDSCFSLLIIIGACTYQMLDYLLWLSQLLLVFMFPSLPPSLPPSLSSSPSPSLPPSSRDLQKTIANQPAESLAGGVPQYQQGKRELHCSSI